MPRTQHPPVRSRRPPLLLEASSAQRLLVQGVMAATGMLMRGLSDGLSDDALRHITQERHRMLRELGNSVVNDAAIPCLAAMTAAVQESDRALEVMLAA